MRVLGIDTGGTFTDFVADGPRGLVAWKVESTPDDPARGILEGIRAGGGLPAGARVHHGTTVATNTVLTRRGARVALVVTRGFADLLHVGRGHRDELYAMAPSRTAPLVRPGDVVELAERLAADGSVLSAPSPAALARVARRVAASGAEAVAVALLHATTDDRHERAVARALARSGLSVHCSAEVGADPREVERAETAVLDAYVGPVVAAYLRRLAAALPSGALSVLKSDGTRAGVEAAIERPVRTLLSGPSAGAAAALDLARTLGLRRALSFDVGGTSTDVCRLEGRALPVTTRATLGGFALGVPSLEVESVGAGGGSIVRVDAGGALRVGPESAGARPGPAAYGHGGPFTLTDAHLLLGRLPLRLLGGVFGLDVAAARRAGERVARRAGVSLRGLCEGAVRVAEATTARALRRASAAAGHDPTGASLVAFGGAGGLLAVRTAALAGLKDVVIPWSPGTFAAQGARVAPRAEDVGRVTLGRTSRELEVIAARLARDAADALRAGGEAVASGTVEADVRLAGRVAETSIPFGPRLEARARAAVARASGVEDPGSAIEVVRLRGRAFGPRTRRVAVPAPARGARLGPPSGTLRGLRGLVPTWRREDLGAGVELRGEAIVTEPGATTYVPPGAVLTVDPRGALRLRGGRT